MCRNIYDFSVSREELFRGFGQSADQDEMG